MVGYSPLKKDSLYLGMEFTEKEIIENIPNLIADAFLYGEFTLEFKARNEKTNIINSSPFDSNLVEKVREAIAKTENDFQAKKSNFLKDIKTAEFSDL